MLSTSDALIWKLLVAAAIGGLIYLLGPILWPFLLAAVLAYMCDPLVDRLESWRVPRTLGALLVMVMLSATLIGVVAIMIPLMDKQLRAFVAELPNYLNWLNSELAPVLRTWLRVDIGFDLPHLQDLLATQWQGSPGFVEKLLRSARAGGTAMLGFIANLFLLPIVLFYLMRDWDKILAFGRGLLPEARRANIDALAREVDSVLGAFLRGQVMVVLGMTSYYVVALLLAGFSLALPLGIIAGLFSFIPYLGFAVGLVLTLIAALLQFHALSPLLLVVGIFSVGQLLEGYVLTPRLVGERIGLHPVVVIFALVAFGQLFGFFGVLLALPISAVLMVWARRATHRTPPDAWQ